MVGFGVVGDDGEVSVVEGACSRAYGHAFASDSGIWLLGQDEALDLHWWLISAPG
jgi:hypothetical protein